MSCLQGFNRVLLKLVCKHLFECVRVTEQDSLQSNYLYDIVSGRPSGRGGSSGHLVSSAWASQEITWLIRWESGAFDLLLDPWIRAAFGQRGPLGFTSKDPQEQYEQVQLALSKQDELLHSLRSSYSLEILNHSVTMWPTMSCMALTWDVSVHEYRHGRCFHRFQR